MLLYQCDRSNFNIFMQRAKLQTVKLKELLALFPFHIGEDAYLIARGMLWPEMWSYCVNYNVENQFDNYIANFIWLDNQPLYEFGTLQTHSFITSNHYNFYAFRTEETALMFKMRYL